MLETITAFAVNYGVQAIAGTIGAAVLGWILHKIPTGKWTKQLGQLGQKCGKAVTDFCRVKIPFWNEVIEPVFIDTLAVIPAFVAGFIIGLKSDNKGD